MQVEMLYGKQGLKIDLPADCRVDVIRKKPMPVIADPVQAVEDALASPVAADPLPELARHAKSACILICDITRPVPNGLILPPLIRTMLDAGVPAGKITVLIATGLHRPNLDAEMAEVVGDDWVLQNVRVENHHARNDEDHTCLGFTSRGTPAAIDRRFVEADLRIVTGLVEPHFMAGFSGGRKLITPGIASEETIRHIHCASLLQHPLAANGVIDGNPLHQEQMEIAAMVGEVFALNTVIDEQRRLSLVNFGHLEQSHRLAAEHMRKHTEVPLDRAYSTVLTSSAGYPLDKTYYQTVKAMVAALPIVQPGGDLIVVSECSEGLGSAEFAEAQRRLLEAGEDEFLSNICARTKAEIDEWETQMMLKATRIANVHLYSTGLSKKEWVLTGVHRAHAATQAVTDSLKRSGENAIAAIPEGPYVLPRLV